VYGVLYGILLLYSVTLMYSIVLVYVSVISNVFYFFQKIQSTKCMIHRSETLYLVRHLHYSNNLDQRGIKDLL